MKIKTNPFSPRFVEIARKAHDKLHTKLVQQKEAALAEKMRLMRGEKTGSQYTFCDLNLLTIGIALDRELIIEIQDIEAEILSLRQQPQHLRQLRLL